MTHQSHFVPLNQKDHERGNRGYDVPDYCANCGQPFDGHHNGVCPQDDDELRGLADDATNAEITEFWEGE